MSQSYTQDVANAQTKCVSRARIANNIINNTPKKTKRVTHYLGGTSHRTPFESFFTRGTQSFFVRYEHRKCDTPRKYMEAKWNESGLIPKDKKQHGYFVNGDFFHNCDHFLAEFPEYKHDMWLDFCGMPTDDKYFQLEKKVFKSIHSSKIRFVYLTFYLNHRGFDDVKEKLNKYGKSLEDRAKSLSENIQEKLLTGTEFECEVFDTYMNDVSPMAVIKVTNKQNTMKKTKTKNREHNATNFGILRKYYTESDIQSLWGVSHQQVAAYKAWLTMRGIQVESTQKEFSTHTI